MAQLKLLFIVANVVLIKFTLASTNGQSDDLDSLNGTRQADTVAVLENINSLDFGSRIDDHWLASKTEQQEANRMADQPRPAKAGKRKRVGKSRQQQASNLAGGLVLSLLSQLDKLDFKRIMASSLAQLGQELGGGPIERRSASDEQKATNKSGPTNGKERGHIGASMVADTGNLLSITKQLVKLARGQVLSDFGSGWWAPGSMTAPSMLSAASHLLHDSSDFHGASLKSDWFWLVAPAVIVIGTGVIVIPLIAAYLVSHLMNQNTFTVTAGRRRRRRQVAEPLAPPGELDLRHLFEAAPQLLINQVSRLNQAFESVESKLVRPGSKEGLFA